MVEGQYSNRGGGSERGEGQDGSKVIISEHFRLTLHQGQLELLSEYT